MDNQVEELFEDSYEAFYELDLTGPENEDVICGSFIWNRGKSNENLTDIRDGKGFSFYLARYVFQDENKVYVKNDSGTGNLIVVGEAEHLMAVVHTVVERDHIRIISAWEVTDTDKYGRTYNKKRYHEAMLSNENKYCMIRKLDMSNRRRPLEGAYPKVIRFKDLDFPPLYNTLSDYHGTPVYVQTIGEKEKCDKMAHVVNICIDHKGYGKEW